MRERRSCMRERTEQEFFWEGEFGGAYINRNRDEQLKASSISLFAKIFSKTNRVQTVMEFGANIGMNIQAIHLLLPDAALSALEINEKAVMELRKIQNLQVHHQSLFDYQGTTPFDFVFTRGVLIHLNPEYLEQASDVLYQSSHRYVCIAEYYNPKPVELSYRSHTGRLFKRDFAGEMLERYPDLMLVDYGFIYHRDGNFPQDDITWFLMEKTGGGI